ncbi:MAG: MBL fold metallo-hydrolase [Acidobacteria bacterium]|nr:MBL fold metallo-hydrolase [Acidobacteriota bacterium]
MRGRTVLIIGLALAPAALYAQAPAASTTFAATGGDITITPIQHASVQIEQAGRVIQVDPAQGDFSAAKKADLVLVTDVHGDHLNPDLIAQVRKPGAPVVMPAAAQAQVGGRVPPPVEVLANGESRTVAGVRIEAVPMYNLQRGPSAGQLFHTKGRGNGYLLTLGGVRLYVAGDTECTPEMKALTAVDVAFIPMNLPYTMTPAEAAACVRAFMPKVVIPYHYQGQSPEEFQAALKGSSVEVRLLDWY